MKRLLLALPVTLLLVLNSYSPAYSEDSVLYATHQVAIIPSAAPSDPSAPAPRAEATGDGEVTLTWEPVEGAERYAVAEAFSNGTYATFTKSLTGTSYTATDLPNGYDHDFLVQAYVNGRWSSFGPASLVRCRPEGTVKPAPAATAGDGSVELSWGRVPGATRYAVAYRNGSGYRTLTTSCSGESFKASGLSNGKSYRFLVQACVYGRWTSFSDSDLVSAAPSDPSAPAPRAEATGDGEVTLTWEPVEGAERYAVAEAFSNGTYATFTKSLTGTSYTATDLPNGYDHDFLVQAYVNGRWSSFGPASLVRCRPEGTVKPAPAATAGDGSVELSWGRVPGATRYAVAYRNGSGYRTLTTSCSGESFKASGLSNGKSYRFLVQACVYGRWTSFSDSDLVSAAPSDPSAPAPRAEATGDGEVTLTWEPVEGAERYAVAEAFSNGTYATFTKSLTGTSYTATDLPNGYDHDFLVQAYVNGRWSSFGPASLVRCRPEGTVKPAPAATAGDGSVELSWGRVPGANQYVVSCSNGKSYRLKSNQTSLEIKGLKNGEEYSFYVRAKIYNRLSALEDTDYITCMPYSLISPKVSIHGVGDGSVRLKWGSVAGASRYAIAYKTRNGYKTVTYDCRNTEFTVDGLTNGQRYSFIVQANIDGRWSPFGSKDLVTAIPEDPNAPKPHLEKATATSCVLSWNQIPGAERYAVALKTGNSYKTYSLDVKESSYQVSGLNPGKTYRFLVQAFVNGKWSSSSDAYLCEAVLEDVRSPQNVKATCPGDGKIQLTWDFVPNATRYAIAEYKNGSYVTFTTNCLGTSYTVSDLTNGRVHKFLVQSYVDGVWSACGDALFVDAVPHGVITPRVTGKAGDLCAHLSWSKVSGATRYAIAVKTNSGYKTYTYNCTGNSYRVEGLNGGQTYQFVVQAYLDGVWSPFDEDDLVSVKPTGTNDTVFGIPRLTVVNWLTSHQYNGYYLGTRYSSGFSYQTCLYPNGAPGPGGYTGMNCTGFVAHVFRSLGVNVDAVAANNNHTPWGAGPGGGGYINAWRWYGYAIDSGCKVYHFNTVADMLNSGLAKKGDVIFFKTDGSIDCHIGFFWGDNSHDNKMWHQILPGNLIGPCFNNANKSEVRQQCVLIK